MFSQILKERMKQKITHKEVDGEYLFINGLGEKIKNFQGACVIEFKNGKQCEYSTWIDSDDGLRSWNFIKDIN